MLYIFSEESGSVIVARDRLRQGDIHMEYVGNMGRILTSVALPCGIDALFLKEVVHRLRVLPEKIVMGGDDIGRGIICGDVFQYRKPGIIGRKMAKLTQIIQVDPLSGLGCPLAHIIHSAV